MVFHHPVGWMLFVLVIQLEGKKDRKKQASIALFSSIHSFSLTLVGPLDYESEQSYRLTVQVRDLGENSLAHFMTIDIYVLDENDNRPQAYITFVEPLINQSRIILRENLPIGQILAHVSISDGDSGLNGQMTYHIERGNRFIGTKTMDQRSFLLVIENIIDRESLHSNIDPFVLIVSDHGNPRQTLRLEYEIFILDENDSPPVFNETIQCNIAIKSSNNQSIGRSISCS